MRPKSHAAPPISLLFQSTHLVWGATGKDFSGRIWDNNFNPRTSCEVRQKKKCSLFVIFLFQSTHLVWGATPAENSAVYGRYAISIHAPRVRCDKINVAQQEKYNYFNPRTSCEVRLSGTTSFICIYYISIHAPRVRCDLRACIRRIGYLNFNPRTSCEVRPPD